MSWAAYFVDSSGEAIVPAEGWQSKLGQHSVTYCGEVVQRAMPLTLEQILPALPPADLSGKLDAVGLSEGSMRELLLNPQLSM